MFDHLKEYNIYIKPGFTDMRKRAGSLSLLVRSEMGMDPREKSIFIFCGRDKRRVTAIVWDSNGWCWSPLILTKKCSPKSTNLEFTDFNRCRKAADESFFNDSGIIRIA